MAGGSGTAIVWLREDLRLADNEALAAAAASSERLLCIYVFESQTKGLRRLGGAARWRLHQSLEALSADLERRGGRLDLFAGDAGAVIPALAKAAKARMAVWSRRYGAAEIAVDADLKARLRAAGVEARSFNARLLHEPWEISRADGKGFMVYSAYWRAACAAPAGGSPIDAPARLRAAPLPDGGPKPLALADLGLTPKKPDWAGGLREASAPGEASAHQRLDAFLEHGLHHYAAARDFPGQEDATSRLSQHLCFGEIGPRQIAAAIGSRVGDLRDAGKTQAKGGASSAGAKFLGELGWREFNYHLLWRHPAAATDNIERRFDAMPWREPGGELDAWRRGRTGYPLVDAGMRELWRTGYMHNRVRMISASFLIKHLLIDWRIGEDWFWDTLCDADPANNVMNWQWVAGCGADAAPYFRIFNPVLQGERFDRDGVYVRRHVPELACMPAKWIHRPWEAPAQALQESGVELGRTYPRPIVDHAFARERALAAFAKVRRLG